MKELIGFIKNRNKIKKELEQQESQLIYKNLQINKLKKINKKLQDDKDNLLETVRKLRLELNSKKGEKEYENGERSVRIPCSESSGKKQPNKKSNTKIKIQNK